VILSYQRRYGVVEASCINATTIIAYSPVLVTAIPIIIGSDSLDTFSSIVIDLQSLSN
jgi:hypothetical protein